MGCSDHELLREIIAWEIPEGLRLRNAWRSSGIVCRTIRITLQRLYQQVRNWVKRYEEMGSAGLEDRRGKRIGSMPARTEEEALRIKVADLERQNRRLQMEIDFLKKLEELEKMDRCL